MIGGHSKFLLVTGGVAKRCDKFLSKASFRRHTMCSAGFVFLQQEVTNGVLQCTALRNEPVQQSFWLRRFTGVAKFPSIFLWAFFVYLWLLLALCFLVVFLSNLPNKCFRT